MAKPTLQIIRVLRVAANELEGSPNYQWGHMGSCNCGFLAQVVTHFTKDEIHRRAMLGCGDWSEQLRDYCPMSGRPFDEIITELLALGFDPDDLRHLERLSDPSVVRQFPEEGRKLLHNDKADAVRYMKVWAGLLEEELVTTITLPDLMKGALQPSNP
jgi:hypothetical protein